MVLHKASYSKSGAPNQGATNAGRTCGGQRVEGLLQPVPGVGKHQRADAQPAALSRPHGRQEGGSPGGEGHRDPAVLQGNAGDASSC